MPDTFCLAARVFSGEHVLIGVLSSGTYPGMGRIILRRAITMTAILELRILPGGEKCQH
jgi:hypothetical protein